MENQYIKKTNDMTLIKGPNMVIHSKKKSTPLLVQEEEDIKSGYWLSIIYYFNCYVMKK